MLRKNVARVSAATVALALVEPVAAHSGTTHGGTPHWLLLSLVVGGVLGLTVAGYAYRRSPSYGTAAAVAASAVVAVLGGIGVMEFQVVGTTPPSLTPYYEPASLVLGCAVAVVSLVVGRLRWPTRPDYAFLGIALGIWILYPAVFPNDGVTSAFGYLLVLTVPAVTAFVVWQDARGVLQSLRIERSSLRIGAAAAGLFTVLLAFSTGSLTLNPDDGANLPTHALVTIMPVSDPLVVWPAVEFYFPSIPAGGYLSVGTALFFGFLAALVGLNVAIIVQQARATTGGRGSGSFLGMVAATGTSACCCCAPALYGAVSVVLGASATPLYWAFMDSSSPLSSGFFALTVLLLTRSIVAAGGANAETNGSRGGTDVDPATA